MKTIENIKVEKTFYRREKDILGNITRTPYQQKVTRNLNLVSPGVRFGYYLIDLVFYYILFVIILIATFAIVLSINPEDYETIYYIEVYSRLIGLGILYLYYTFSEFLFGASPGKAICGYTVINEHAAKPSFGHIALRSIIRFIPFEAFSCFGERAWHDKWSKTYVVKRKEREELKKLLKTNTEHQDLLD
jgi:uncharacterized RDD family membrane protein YckC